MTLPINRTAKTALDTNLVNGITSDAPKVKASNDVLYNTIDELNSKVDSHAGAPTLAHPDGSVSRAKLALKAVGPSQLDDASVGQSHHQDNGIPSRALPDNVILKRHMSDNSVGSAELQPGAVQAQHIASGAVTADKFVPGALTNDTQNGLRITALEADTTTALALKVDKGKSTETFTEVISTDTRPVLKTISETFTPNALITAVTDIHGIDLIVDTSTVANLGTNKVSLYPFESRSDNKGAGSILLGTGGYFLVRNSGGGAMASAKALRVNISNSGVGSAITNAMGINIDNPTNSTGGTALNTFNGIYFDPLTAPVNNNYAIYINAVTGGANRNYGIYDLAAKNYFTGEIKIDNNNLQLGAMAFNGVGASGTHTIAIQKGTAPVSQVSDSTQIYTDVLPNTKSTLGLLTQEIVATDASLTSTHSLTVMINKQKYKIMMVLVP